MGLWRLIRIRFPGKTRVSCHEERGCFVKTRGPLKTAIINGDEFHSSTGATCDCVILVKKRTTLYIILAEVKGIEMDIENIKNKMIGSAEVVELLLQRIPHLRRMALKLVCLVARRYRRLWMKSLEGETVEIFDSLHEIRWDFCECTIYDWLDHAISIEV